MMIKDIVSRYQ